MGRKKKLKKKKQSGILPYRVDEGRVEVLLVTTSTGRHWTIPKGNVKGALGAAKSAAEEGWEEAGVSGQVREPYVGTYELKKRGKLFSVKVFLCRVTEIALEFPEKDFRQTRWATLAEAAELVKNKGLRQLLSGLEGCVFEAA